MPDSTISSLPLATSFDGSELIPLVQQGQTKSGSILQITQSAVQQATSIASAAAAASQAAASSASQSAAAAAASASAMQVSDYAALRAVTANMVAVFVTGYLATAAPSGIAGLFTRDDSDTTSADNGGTVIVAANGKRWKRRFDGAVNVKWFGAKGDSATDDTAAIQAAINAGRSVFAPAGTYVITKLSLLGKYITLQGEGIGKTVFICNDPSTTTMLDANEAADVRISPLVIRGMTLNANGKAQTCLDLRYRHLTNFEDVHFIGATAQNIKAKDTYLMRASQCLSEGSPVGMWLVGSNHRSKFDSFSFQGNSVWQVKIEKAGTAADGNIALEFSNCDLEFAAGGGAYIDATDVSFRTCYLGENIDGAVLQVQNGSVLVEGGGLFFGHSASAFGAVVNGGKTLFRKVGVNGQLNPGMGMLLSGSGTNAVRFEDCTGNTTIGGGPVIAGDLLDYGPSAVVYAKRLGKSFTAKSLNSTITSAVAGNAQTVTCASVTGAPAIISLECPLAGNADWRDGEAMYLVLVYESNKPVSLKLSGSSFGGAPNVTLGGAPATTKVTTLIKLDGVMPNGTYNIVEIYNDSAVVSDYIKVYEFFLADSRMLAKGTASWGNLYKC
jgi:hypothetical protein